MALFPTDALNEGVKKREVFGWAMYDFANSGYTTVVLTAVFNAYFVGVIAGGAPWATLAWTLTIAASSLVVMLLMPALGAWADIKAAERYGNTSPFSLIVSLKAPEGTDLFTETRVAAEAASVLVEHPVLVEV